MNRNRYMVVILILVVLFISFLLFLNKETEIKQSNSEATLASQEGLPSIVELKRQAIYKATINNDFEALSAEPDPALRYSFGEHIDDGFSKYIKECDTKNCSELQQTIQTLLTMPYGKQSGIYFWPAVFGKSSDEWTEEDINQMKVLLSDEEIESYRMFGGYAYYRLGITEDGKWIYYIAGD